jgi:hypothetical protein
MKLILFLLIGLQGTFNSMAFTGGEEQAPPQRQKFKDTVFQQAYSIKYLIDRWQDPVSPFLKKVYCDRNGVVQIYSSEGLLRASGGEFLVPGELVPDITYRPMADRRIKDISLYQNQFVYGDDKAVFSNAWAGKLYDAHNLPGLKMICGGKDFSFLISDGTYLQYRKDALLLAELKSADKLEDIVFDKKRNLFWLLGENSVSVFDPKGKKITEKYKGNSLTCFALSSNGSELIIGTRDGYYTLDAGTGKVKGALQNKLPCPDLTVIKEIGGKIWFGSANGAFMRESNGKYKYYASKRWIPSNKITDISAGSFGSVLILTDKGLSEIHFTAMTLLDKAMYYEQQVRSRHIRLGFNSTISRMKNGDLTTGSLEDSDNDGLWTSMYLGAEVFRYAATKSPEALENCKESLDAMERLYTINSLKGFPSRSFERKGYAQSDTQVWRNANDPEWVWKSTTSSDEAIGHMFVFGAIAELIEVPEVKNKAIKLMDALMEHIVEHEMYMIDWNGKPTMWGRWNPEYVNARPLMVGDRKITSSNIVSMLQTAYHFTGKTIYKEKALELMNKYGFLENLMRPMKSIGRAPEDADILSKDLSDGWNHSDDEMYFVGYWGLYRYALNDTLKKKFRDAIIDHWEIERPEKEGAWNIFTAITGIPHFDLEEAVWYLQKYPLDMINWRVKNSERRDIVFIPQNFRRQTIKEVLPPDELAIERHNGNRFDLDGGRENGSAENSAGDIWLLPYWMGRYLEVISTPTEKKQAKIAVAGTNHPAAGPSTVYKDIPFNQRYSIKYFLSDTNSIPFKIYTDHNNNIKALSKDGLMIVRAGALLRPGTLVKDVSYRPMAGKKISDICLYKNEFVYLDNKAVLSNAWAGTLYTRHGMPGANIISAGKDFNFLISDGHHVALVSKEEVVWRDELSAEITEIQYQENINKYWLLTSDGLYQFSPDDKKLSNIFKAGNFTCFQVLENKILLGTHNGYEEAKGPAYQLSGELLNKLPSTDITVIKNIDGQIWFGSTDGAFMLKENGEFDYYASERWLPGNHVIDISKGDKGSILVLTDKGLGKICTAQMTLEEKAAYYEEIVRQRHIRYGFYSDYTSVKNGDIANAQMGPHDSDNLWTSMYLSGELFRYLVTRNPEAKQNCIESIDAMERLFTLSGIKGLFGRSIERRGVVAFKDEIRREVKDYWYPGYDSVPSSWRHSPDSAWDWRGSASSDQAVGQYFALTMIAQYMDDEKIKQKAIRLIDELTGYILENDLKLIDADGRPSLWGIWSPEYVNRFPDMVGDKKLYSSNIISFLQIAWHFTKKEKYRDKAIELLYKEKYLENLTRPIKEIGPAPPTADKWSQLLSGGWNCSDDEMYFLAYLGLAPFAINDTLKAQFQNVIRDHWEFIRPEKEGLWNLIYGAISGSKNFDLDAVIWELKRMPMDLINWPMQNSSRKDLTFIKENNLERPTTTVLPPDERPENKHNRNLFKLDEVYGGNAELGGGDVYLLPYWMGRYFGVIGADEEKKTTIWKQ